MSLGSCSPPLLLLLLPPPTPALPMAFPPHPSLPTLPTHPFPQSEKPMDPQMLHSTLARGTLPS
eukprot:2777045-Pyramimonas_sp.AAC.1